VKLSRSVLAFSSLLLASSAISPLQAQSTVAGGNGLSLPYATPVFKGQLNPTVEHSANYLPGPVKAPAGAPNIIVILNDDVGFGASSTFGGPVPTPNFTKLAMQGARYTQFNTTAMCSATRAAFLTGRNQHVVGVASVEEASTPYPGYDGLIPNNADTIAEILHANGYVTAMFGKHHDIPTREMYAAEYSQWPTELGFDYFYGYIGGETDQFHPHLYEGTQPLAGLDHPSDYILDNDLANRAIDWIHLQKAAAPDKPFFLYYATGSTHAPQQAPASWIAKFKGKFDEGWDQQRSLTLAKQKSMGIMPASADMSAWPSQIPHWDSLTAEEKIVDERYMEVYAAQLAYEDSQVGRVIDEVRRMGIANNTIIIWIQGDNGASGEGGPNGAIAEEVSFVDPDKSDTTKDHWLAQHLDIMGGPGSDELYPIGWALAMDAPYPWTKQIASHLGGIRNGVVISWPGHMADVGGFRTQYAHIIDILPTLLDITHIKAPDYFNGIRQLPLDGVSMASSFEHPDAPSLHTTQYYEVLGNRGIYHDGWLANTTPQVMPWNTNSILPNGDVLHYPWELYDLKTDPAQAHDLAATDPQRLKQMQALFDQQAREYDVYPIQNTGVAYRSLQMLNAAHTPLRAHYVFWGPGIGAPTLIADQLFWSSFTITADVTVPHGGANGVILAVGSMFGGWSFYLKDGKPTAYASVSVYPGLQTRVSAGSALAAGEHHLVFAYKAGKAGGVVTISDNGTVIANGQISKVPRIFGSSSETMDVGEDTGAQVTDDYSDGGVFTGDINKVVLDATPLPPGLLKMMKFPDAD
jgi:arylsulfatase A-like enzyme